MKEQNDRELFGSKFQDFGAPPSDDVWKGIQAGLPKKRKKRVFILWFSTLSASAVLALGFFTFSNPSFFKDFKRIPTVVITSDEFPSTQKNAKSTPLNTLDTSDNSNRKMTLKTGVDQQLEKNQGLLPKVKVQDSENAGNNPSTKNSFDNKLRGLNSLTKLLAALSMPDIPLKDSSKLIANNSNSINEKKDTIDTKKQRVWWFGVNVEQSNNFSSNKSKMPVPSPSTAFTSSDWSYYWYRSRSIALTAQVAFENGLQLEFGGEFSKWDNLNKESSSLVPSASHSVGIPLRVGYKVVAVGPVSLGVFADNRFQYFYNYSDNFNQLEFADMNSSSGNSTMSYTPLKGYQWQTGVGFNLDAQFLKHFKANVSPSFNFNLLNNQDLNGRFVNPYFGIRTGIYYSF